MNVDTSLLYAFEKTLVPTRLDRSEIPVEILGYGEISSIFQIGDDDRVVYKRIPLFSNETIAESYRRIYLEYCNKLREAGIELPQDDVIFVQVPGRIGSLYFVQQRFQAEQFCHQLIHQLNESQITEMLGDIINTLTALWQFNDRNLPEYEIAVDAQLSNWVWALEDGIRKLYLVDTTTPFIRKQGAEQLDVNLLLSSVPWLIRWPIKKLNLDDVISRYYDKRNALIDLTANLYKEQRPDLIPLFLQTINDLIPDAVSPLDEESVDRYYREDKRIWTLFSALRRLDRFITTQLLRRRYEFILPGKVKR